MIKFYLRKLWIFSSLLGFTLLFSFQNCQQTPYQDESSPPFSQSISQHDVLGNKISLSGENLSKVLFYFEEKKLVTNQGRSYALLVNKIYDIDLRSKEIKISDNTGEQSSERYCLSKQLSTELENLLQSSAICKDTEQPTSKVCSQALAKPYAAIITDTTQYDLGFATDGCGSNRLDLCDSAHASLLKGIGAAVRNNLVQLPCK